MRSVCGLPPRSTLTLTRTLPLLFAPHRLGSRREQLLTGFRAERSPFLLRPLLPVPRQILPAPLPFPPLPSSLLRVPPLERPLRRLLRRSRESLHSLRLHWRRLPPGRSRRSGSPPGRFCPPSFRRSRESPSVVRESSTRASRRN